MSDSFTGVNRLSLLQGIFPTQGSNSSLPHGRRILYQLSITLPTKVHLVKDMFFPVVTYGCESWTIKKAQHERIGAFEQWCWRRLLRGPWTTRRSNQLLLKEISSVQFNSITQSCPTLCDPMNCSTPGLPVHHQLPEFTQTHAHRVGDAIQPSYPLSSPSPPAPNPSQHQGLSQ